MKNNKLARLLCVILCLSLFLCACEQEQTPTTTVSTAPTDAIYTVSVKTNAGVVPEDVVVYIYEDASMTDLLVFGPLNNKGEFTFTDRVSDQYVAFLQNIPEEGYDLKEYYPLTGTRTDIVLTSSIITGVNPLDRTYQLGDIMRDFTVTTCDGEELTLSEILKTKKAVVLNFWFTKCDPCKMEFPLLQEAYEAYKDEIEVIAMNPVDKKADQVKQFRDDMGLTMPVACVDPAWGVAMQLTFYPTTMVIDRYGRICLIESGGVDDVALFENLFAYFAADDYQQKLLGSMEELGSVEYPKGHVKNPFEAYAGVDSFEVTVEAGQEVHAIVYRATDGVTIRIEDPNAYVVYENVRYEPNGAGVVELEVVTPDAKTGAPLIIGNTGVTASTIRAAMILPMGSMTNPYDLELGKLKVDIKADNERGVYYLYTAETAGTIKVTLNGIGENELYDVQMYNMNTMAMSSLSDALLTDEDGNPYVMMDAAAGENVRISFHSLPDSKGKYPAISIEAEITQEEKQEDQKIPYTVTVRDDAGNPMAGVTVTVNVDGAAMTFQSDESGVILMELESGNYILQLTVPEGYVAGATQYLLTAGNPNREITLTLYVPQVRVYTVRVLNAIGEPMAGIAVSVADQAAWTDDQGQVSFTMMEGDHVVTILYNGKTITRSFGAETMMEVKLGATEMITYSVQVVHVNGGTVQGAVVRFQSADGQTAALVDLKANGLATAELLAGQYTVSLMFKDSALGHEKITTKLTMDNPSITVEVAPHASGTPDNIRPNTSAVDLPAYHMDLGGTYVNLNANGVAYFLFTPIQSGIYEITTTNPAAQVENWNTRFTCVKTDVGVNGNVLTLEVENPGLTYVIGIRTNADLTGTILKITRTGDYVEKEPEQIVYAGTRVPTTPYVLQIDTNQYFKSLNLAEGHLLVKDMATGFYHLDSVYGPVVLVDLTLTNHGISIANLIANGEMVEYTYDVYGNIVRRIDYTQCMSNYVANADAQYGVYPLTDDLMIMLKGYGKTEGWFDPASPAYLFRGEYVLPGNEWMFLLCYIV